MNPDKFIFGFNANLGGFTAWAWGSYLETGSGPSLSLEFSRGNFNSEINFMVPFAGFGTLITFNYFGHSRIGGGYIGGGIGYSFYEAYGSSGYPFFRYERYIAHSLTVGLNGGYKFVTRSGVYFRTGAFVGFDFGCYWNRSYTMPIYIKPDLAIGWTMR